MALTEVPVPEAVLARRPPGLPAPSSLRLSALAAAGLVLLPLAAVVLLALRPAEAAPGASALLRYARDTALLSSAVALGSSFMGALAAWLVVMHRFPGRGVFEWALALPLAAPAYVLAYSYADLLDVAGPVQAWLRGAGLPSAWLQARSLPAAALILSAAFYPYVYLTARAAFLNQSACALDAARTLGCTGRQAFLRVALPLARPAIAAGAALAVMETLADYGAVTHLGVQTLTTGVVRAYVSYGSAEAAARLSLALLSAAAILLWIERLGRSGRAYSSGARAARALVRTPLPAPAAWGATAFCGALLVAALVLPAAWLAVRAGQAVPDWARLGRAAGVSLGLAAAGTAVTLALALAIALGARRNAWPARLASLGYATPGAVMAIGLLAPAALLWRTVGAPAGAASALGLLLYAYAARLTAAALEPLDAGLTRVTPSMERAARTLGETEAGALGRVHLPLAKGALWTAALLVLVDVLKELPATLMLRPFDFDTLAVAAANYAADERLANAAWPALLIVLLAVGPVMFLSHRVARSRPGAP